MDQHAKRGAQRSEETMAITGLTRTEALLLLQMHVLARVATVMDRIDQHLAENAELAEMQRKIAHRMIREMEDEPWRTDEP